MYVSAAGAGGGVVTAINPYSQRDGQSGQRDASASQREREVMREREREVQGMRDGMRGGDPRLRPSQGAPQVRHAVLPCRCS